MLSCKSSSNDENELKINPISHATFVMEYGDHVIYVDPVGGKTAFEGFKPPTLILITDIHGDHLSNETLLELNASNITKIVPEAVKVKLDSRLQSSTIVLNNDEIHTFKNEMIIEAVPMYNLREDALKFHPKGRGNGYVITIDSKRIYISGDTEDIKEMRQLNDIDIAFVCMNLPYTMTVESAASAVLDFKPKQIYPYHYRGKNGKSDVALFKSLIVKGNSNINVIQLNWY